MPEILVTKEGALGHIRLNRPKALNSLTLDMVRAISAALDEFETDDAVAVILVTGEGDRAFCAGGDIRAIHDSGKAKDGAAQMFFAEEYRMNARIAAYPKPYIAIMDGITMGGGIGLSAHGSLRIVTERTRAAMPETGIGLFPDVGGTYLLPRAPGETGTYLGLTGESIGASDAIFTGLADMFVKAGDIPPLIGRLRESPTAAAIAAFAQAPETTPMQAHATEINRIFAHDQIEDIITDLENSETPFLQETLAKLRTKSPTSLKLTLRLLRLGRISKTLEACLDREYAACETILRNHDFYEGVRAAVIDKDRAPHWSPASLADVSDFDIETYLQPAASSLWEHQA